MSASKKRIIEALTRGRRAIAALEKDDTSYSGDLAFVREVLKETNAADFGELLPWHRVGAELPDDETTVLCACSDDVHEGYHTDGKWFYQHHPAAPAIEMRGVFAWREMPGLPNAETMDTAGKTREALDLFLAFLDTLPAGWLGNVSADIGLLNRAFIAARLAGCGMKGRK